MDRKDLPPAFIKPVETEGKLRKGFIKLEEEQYFYAPAVVEQIEGQEIYFPDQRLAQSVKNELGEEQILSAPFRKGRPVEEVSPEEVYRAMMNGYRYENAALKTQIALLQQCISTEAPVESAVSRKEPVTMPYTSMTEIPFGMRYRNDDTGKEEWLCNFLLFPESVLEVFDRDVLQRKSIKFKVQTQDEEKTLVIDAECTGEVAKEVCKQVIGAHISAVVSKCEAKIAEEFIKKLRKLPVEIHQKSPGWMEWEGKRIFAHDACTRQGLRMETGMAVIFDEKNRYESLDIMRNLLSIAPKSTSAPMVGTCFLAPLHELFEKANPAYEPHFALFVNGKSGSLKTAVSKVVFSMYNADKPMVPASFRDTPTAIEMRLKEYPCAPVLLDDFYSTGIRKELTDMQKILEMVIRYVGDGIGKNRSNSFLQDVKGVRPSGMVVITGEDTAGQLSTLLRCLILNVTKSTFNKEILTSFQNEPLRWSSVLYFFIKYVESHYTQILEQIRMRYPEVRKLYEKEFEDLRPVDQLTQLHITFEIVGGFLSFLEPDKSQYIEQLSDECIAGCFQAVKMSQEYAVVNSGESQYLHALTTLVFDKTIRIAETRSVYAEYIQEYDGFMTDEYYFLRSDMVYTKIRKYFRDQGRELAVSELNANRALDQAGVLITEIEQPGTEKEKKLLEVKVKIGNKRPRMLKIIRRALDSFNEG